jgi:nicotinate-nucleotide pyrophosphorylase (carboxylating)
MKNVDEQLKALLKNALNEDIGDGDHSTISCIPIEKKGKAILKIKQKGILAGMNIAEMIFKLLEPNCTFTTYKSDGDNMQKGEVAFEINASIHTILKGERVVLNCMQRMSGIATLTNTYVQKLNGYRTKILDTRKTTPNFRLLEKQAVAIGGATNHRFGLYDMIMLKDNHIDYAGGITQAVNKAFDYVCSNNYNLKIEVETRNIKDVEEVCNNCIGKVDRIMLDNFSPEQITAALKIIDQKIETEASGGINLDTILDYAATGVDYISVGGLIHQAKSLDLSLKALIV